MYKNAITIEELKSMLVKLCQLMDDKPIPPTRREICDVWSFASTGTVQRNLKKLESKGWIKLYNMTSRGIAITEKGKKIYQDWKEQNE